MLYDHLPAARHLAAQCWCDAATSHITMDPALAEAVAYRIAAWMDTSAEHLRNECYYRDLLVRCGKAIGDQAFIADDGNRSEDVLVAKVPELVERLGAAIQQPATADKLQGKLAPLEPINHQLRTQDNRITQYPMFCVQVKRRDVGYDSIWVDNHCWHDSANGETIYDDDPDFKEPEGEEWDKFGYVDRWETVMVAFTQAGCEEYLRLNGHNLHGETRIYAESFYRCPEMIAIRKFLLELSNL